MNETLPEKLERLAAAAKREAEVHPNPERQFRCEGIALGLSQAARMVRERDASSFSSSPEGEKQEVPPGKEPCPSCHGVGRLPLPMRCPECDGIRFLDPDVAASVRDWLKQFQEPRP